MPYSLVTVKAPATGRRTGPPTGLTTEVMHGFWVTEALALKITATRPSRTGPMSMPIPVRATKTKMSFFFIAGHRSPGWPG